MSNKQNYRKTSAKCPELVKDFYKVSEAGKIIKKSPDTVSRLCGSGDLPAIPVKYGAKSTWKIPKVSIQIWFQQLEQELEQERLIRAAKAKRRNQKELLDDFEKACFRGMIPGTRGKIYSPATLEGYRFYLGKFFDSFEEVTVRNLERILLDTDTAPQREKMHRAIICFSKFLKGQGLLSEEDLAEMVVMAPEPNKEPKRETVSEEQLEAIYKAVDGNLRDKLTVYLLANTGIRSCEFTGIQVQHVDLKERFVSVKRKGGKWQDIGLNPTVTDLMQAYLKTISKAPEAYLFPDKYGKRMTRFGLRERLERIGTAGGVPHLRAHALRRAFVTINANKGRSLVHLQHACGHSNIKITRDYCRTTEIETAKAMREW